MTKLEKIKVLEEAKKQLKTEFTGLDSIIDEIITSITPWFVTPEVIVRPVIVSLWGMTGTGKSSVVRRLIDLLNLKYKTLFFDCGAETSDSSSYKNIGDDIVSFLDNDHSDYGSVDETFSKEMIYVFDEFQYARTVDRAGDDIINPHFRPVWSLLDSGIINLTDSAYETRYFKGFVEDFSAYVDSHKDIELKNLRITKEEDIRDYLNIMGYFYYDSRGVPNDNSYTTEDYDWDESRKSEKEEKKFDYSPLKIIDNRIIRILVKRSGKRVEEATKEFGNIKSTHELKDYLLEALKTIQAPKFIDSSKALIFVIGNLDEAFRVENDTNPDLDADMYYDLTSKVTVMDIKDALKTRFRAEQIARFGNTMIKYPTLKKAHFEEIIKKEVQRICAKFKDDTKIEVKPSADILDLLYNEGVYPVQGVRPIFTTIGTIFTPLLSNITISSEKDPSINSVDIVVVNPGIGYKTSIKEIELQYSNGEKERKEIEMHLGRLRNPRNRKTRYICAVHELGHAVMSAYLTGNVPNLIVSVSADSGGFCMTYDSDREREIRSRKDIQNDVMIGLGGYEAELLVYGDKDRCLLGAGNDIQETWESLRDSAYRLGYFSPLEYRNYEVYNSDLPGGLKDDQMYKKLEGEFSTLEENTRRILRGNIELIKKAALKLGETGSMTGNEFIEFINNIPGNTLTADRIVKAKAENSYEFYKETLEK